MEDGKKKLPLRPTAPLQVSLLLAELVRAMNRAYGYDYSFRVEARGELLAESSHERHVLPLPGGE